jgi:single-strand DNA-binding protein
MASYNKVILMGNLTQDPKLSYLPSQTPVCEIRLAVNRRWRTQDGQQREDVCFIDCRAMARQAETINQYMRKGQPILIEGRLEFDQWEQQDGTKRSKHRVFIERFTFVGSGGGAGGGGGQAPRPAAQSAAPTGGQPPAPQTDSQVGPPNAYEESGAGEEIPF